MFQKIHRMFLKKIKHYTDKIIEENFYKKFIIYFITLLIIFSYDQQAHYINLKIFKTFSVENKEDNDE